MKCTGLLTWQPLLISSPLRISSMTIPSLGSQIKTSWDAILSFTEQNHFSFITHFRICIYMFNCVHYYISIFHIRLKDSWGQNSFLFFFFTTVYAVYSCVRENTLNIWGGKGREGREHRIWTGGWRKQQRQQEQRKKVGKCLSSGFSNNIPRNWEAYK